LTRVKDQGQILIVKEMGTVMARPPQVNFEVDKQLEAEINAVIAKSGMKRPEYYRMISREFIKADAEGRPFLSGKEGIDQARFAELFYKLDPLAAELDRSLREVTRLQARLQKSITRDEREITQTASAAAQLIAGKISAELLPLREELRQLIAMAAAPPWAEKMNTKLDRAIELAKRPRLQRTYQLSGWNLNGWGWTAVGLGSWIASVATFLILAAIIPGLGGWSANILLGRGPQAICALANHQLGRSDCHMVLDNQGRAVLAFGDDKPSKVRK